MDAENKGSASQRSGATNGKHITQVIPIDLQRGEIILWHG
jgi:hypothetical protein